jgi:hypothetical protein
MKESSSNTKHKREGGRILRKRARNPKRAYLVAELTSEASRILEQALALSVEEQEALAESLISNLSGKVDQAGGPHLRDDCCRPHLTGGAPRFAVSKRGIPRLPALGILNFFFFTLRALITVIICHIMKPCP